MNSNDIKKLSLLGLRLQKYLNAYHRSENNKGEALQKFKDVWGPSMASHFLMKYDDAESLIWAFDNDNLKLFLDKF